MSNFRIGSRKIGLNHKPMLIAELGINHIEYSHTTKLTDITLKSLSADFN